MAGTIEAVLRRALARPVGFALLLALVLFLVPHALRASEPELGLRAPACELTRIVAAGEDASRSESYTRAFEGRVTLVDFWASWCPTCERAFGALNALARDYREAGLDVVAVNLDSNLRDALDFLADRPIEFEIARDATGRCPRGFGLVGMPQAFLVDATGRIQAVTRGFRSGDARILRERIEALLAGTAGTAGIAAAQPALPAVAADRRTGIAAPR